MLKFNFTDSSVKPFVVSTVLGLTLAACGDSAPKTTTSTGNVTQYEVEGDHSIGSETATVSVVEYASVVCGACANWHNTVYPDFKKKYIDTGKVRFTFREFPTQPANLARAGFLIANCADDDKFMENISLQFKRQRAILSATDVRQEYINMAKAAGMSEDAFNACLNNEEENARLDAVEQAAEDLGVVATPTFAINGEIVRKVDGGQQLFTIETFDTVLMPLLGENPAAIDNSAEQPAQESVPQ